MSKLRKRSSSEPTLIWIITICILGALPLLARASGFKIRLPNPPGPWTHASAPPDQAITKTGPVKSMITPKSNSNPDANFGVQIKNQASDAVRNLHAELGDPSYSQ